MFFGIRDIWWDLIFGGDDMIFIMWWHDFLMHDDVDMWWTIDVILAFMLMLWWMQILWFVTMMDFLMWWCGLFLDVWFDVMMMILICRMLCDMHEMWWIFICFYDVLWWWLFSWCLYVWWFIYMWILYAGGFLYIACLWMDAHVLAVWCRRLFYVWQYSDVKWCVKNVFKWVNAL